MGSLSYFKEENAPVGSAQYCSDCKLRDCEFRAQTIYASSDPIRSQFSGYFCARERTRENILSDLTHSQYDRCVFRCDNDVVDHQTSIMQFSNGKTACHTMTAFSQEIYRDLKIHGTKAELYGHMEHNVIEVRPYGQEAYRVTPELPDCSVGGHCGGDYCMMNNVYKALCGEAAEGISYLSVSVESHLMAFAAERARVSGRREWVTRTEERT
ncbi:MAG: gfo/Idh/MocA family oxidoreductase, partial [Clostridia bacterium]|nr:gfo/Idh/MocA family oxidoreductase [Clostridia bacterium]